jgi:hypothetical protein
MQYPPSREARLTLGLSTFGDEALAAKTQGARALNALQHHPAATRRGSGEGTPPDPVYCGDDQDAKNTAAKLTVTPGSTFWAPARCQGGQRRKGERRWRIALNASQKKENNCSVSARSGALRLLFWRRRGGNLRDF